MNTQIFRKLRFRIVFIGTSMMVLLMLAVCLTVYFSTAESLKSNSIAVLDYTADILSGPPYQYASHERLPEESSRVPSLREEEADPPPTIPSSLDTLLLSNVLIVYHDDSGNIIKANRADHPIDHLEVIGEKLPDTDNFKAVPQGKITLKGINYRYKYIVVEDQPILLLISREGELSNLPPLMGILTSVGIAACLILLIVCFVLAGLIIRPISDAWNAQQQFLHDASHELKTPLAVIATNIEAVRSSPDETVASQDKWLQYAAEETEDMRKMVHYMLALAKNDNPQMPNQPHLPFSLSETVTEAGLIMEANALEAGIELNLQVEEDLWTVGIREGIKHVVMILLDNALKNTFADGKITLELHRNKNNLLISCTNTGHGIPKEELQNIFKRFYRVDPSRARESGGNGLGLAIAESVIRTHNGKIWAESELDQYARFMISLPAAPAKSMPLAR